jgi:hypothetical protein
MHVQLPMEPGKAYFFGFLPDITPPHLSDLSGMKLPIKIHPLCGVSLLNKECVPCNFCLDFQGVETPIPLTFCYLPLDATIVLSSGFSAETSVGRLLGSDARITWVEEGWVTADLANGVSASVRPIARSGEKLHAIIWLTANSEEQLTQAARTLPGFLGSPLPFERPIPR